jgi:hypothetical protein
MPGHRGTGCVHFQRELGCTQTQPTKITRETTRLMQTMFNAHLGRVQGQQTQRPRTRRLERGTFQAVRHIVSWLQCMGLPAHPLATAASLDVSWRSTNKTGSRPRPERKNNKVHSCGKPVTFPWCGLPPNHAALLHHRQCPSWARTLRTWFCSCGNKTDRRSRWHPQRPHTGESVTQTHPERTTSGKTMLPWCRNEHHCKSHTQRTGVESTADCDARRYELRIGHMLR